MGLEPCGCRPCLLAAQIGERRIAATLDELFDVEFRLTMTRGDIGNYLGLTVETISRLLGRFQKSGMLAVKGKYITIENGESRRGRRTT